MFQRKILRGLMLALALVVALLPSLALADPCGPHACGVATHDVGTIELQIDDDGGTSGWYTLEWPSGTDHMGSACLMVGNSTFVSDGCS